MLALNLQNITDLGRVFIMATGAVIILLAVATHLFQLDLAQLFTWLETAFGPGFTFLYLSLTGLAILSVSKISDKDGVVWLEVGQQCAAGIATLALTFTLLGISLGIESLSKQQLSPDTVNSVIQELTRHFSTAFLTTIVGLPTANLLRAWISVRWTVIENQKETTQ